MASMQVTLVDVSDAAVVKGVAAISASLDKLVSKAKLESEAAKAALGRIAVSTDIDKACENADVVIEAVPERMQLKLDLFRRMDAIAKPGCVFATNTSSLSVTEIAGATPRAADVVGLHFFNPVPLMELVEIIVGISTSAETVEKARTFASAIGKKSIVVKDFPGFATSRLGVILGAEAIRMLEQGVASAADIDAAMELGYKHPMGPLKLTDLVGLDVRLAILDHLHRELGEQFRPPALLRQMVRAGKLGRKSGEGFYRY